MAVRDGEAWQFLNSELRQNAAIALHPDGRPFLLWSERGHEFSNYIYADDLTTLGGKVFIDGGPLSVSGSIAATIAGTSLSRLGGPSHAPFEDMVPSDAAVRLLE